MAERIRQRSRGTPGPGRAVRVRAAAILFLVAGALAPGPLRAQFTLRAPSGETLAFDSTAVREMLGESRRLRSILEEDPAVLYYVGSGPAVTPEAPEPAYPWEAVRAQSDSVARIAFPANYREADRAYYNYAVRKMESIRSAPPAARCSVVVEREVELASTFTDGWIVARTLFGGPAFAPLDAFAFAREAGHMRAMIVALGNDALGGCLRGWREEHREELDAYRAWRARSFDGRDAEAGERSLQEES